MLLDAWGDDFLDHGELDLRFVGMVVAGETIVAKVEIAADLEGGDRDRSREHVRRSGCGRRSDAQRG